MTVAPVPRRSALASTRAGRLGPLGIAGIYAALSVGWILLSDRLLLSLVEDPALLTALQTAKGWAFVVASAVLLYVLVGARVTADDRRLRRAVDAEGRARAILQGAVDAMLVVDSAGTIVDANSAAPLLTGRTREELVGSRAGDVVGEGGPAYHGDSGVTRRERKLARPSGDVVWVELSVSGSPDAQERLVVLRDVTERRVAVERLGTHLDLLEGIARGRPVSETLAEVCRSVERETHGALAAVMLADEASGTLTLAAGPSLPPGLQRALTRIPVGPKGGAAGRAASRSVATLAAGPLDAGWGEEHGAVPGVRASWSTPVVSAAGQLLGTFDLHYPESSEVRTDDLRAAETAARLLAVALERPRAEREIARLAFHDALTGLPNRLLFDDRLRIASIHARYRDGVLAIVAIDLDRFGALSATLGPSAGDEVLRLAGDRLRRAVFDSDTVARHGGDEFLVLLSRLASVDDVLPVVERLHERFRAPFLVGGRERHVTFSAGVSVFPDDGREPDALVRAATTALHRAKALGGDRYELFTKEMHERALERLDLEVGLRRALGKGELRLEFQPVFAVASGAMVGAEALLRWDAPEKGPVPPSAFIPLAEESGLIVPIGGWVLREACRSAASWQRPGAPPIRVGVNVSVRQLERPGFVDTVRGALEEAGLPASLLEIEVTESASFGEDAMARWALDGLSALGVRLALDDFGTGYSSVAALRELPLQALKVDRSFLAGAPEDERTRSVVQASIAFGHALGLSVVAEGVETEAQLELLRDLGCDHFQGFLAARPLDGGGLLRLLDAPVLKSGG